MHIEIVTKYNCHQCNELKTNLLPFLRSIDTITYLNLDNGDLTIDDLTARMGYTPRSVPIIFADDVLVTKQQLISLLQKQP